MWLRWNQSTNIFEKSTDDGATWSGILLDAIILTQGVLATARIPPISPAMLVGGIPASKLIVTDLILTESQITGLLADLAALEAADSTKAPLASPALTGNPTAPTPTPGDNDTSIATTAFVRANVSTPRVGGAASSATPTPDVDSQDLYDLTALAVAAGFVNPTGTPVNGQKLIIRIKDNGAARALTWGTAYIAGGANLPSTTILSKILTLGFIYNTANALNKWQCVAASQEV